MTVDPRISKPAAGLVALSEAGERIAMDRANWLFFAEGGSPFKTCDLLTWLRGEGCGLRVARDAWDRVYSANSCKSAVLRVTLSCSNLKKQGFLGVGAVATGWDLGLSESPLELQSLRVE